MPSAFNLSILVNDVEMISFIPFESMSFVDYPTRVSYFNFTIENPSSAPALHDSVIILSGTTVIFVGNIVELNERKRDNGITTTYELECADFKIKLMKSYLIRAEYTGSDTTILANLLLNTYPDLTSYFDFDTNVTSFLSDMALDTNENSLLDALNELAELAGGAAWRFDLVLPIVTVDYDSGYSTYVNSQVGIFTTFAEAAIGNPGNALQGLFAGSLSPGDWFQTTVTLPASVSITNAMLDFYVDSDSPSIVWYIEVWDGGVLQVTFISTFAYGADPSPVWRSEDILNDAFNPEELPVTGDEVRFKLITGGTPATNDWRIDNLKIIGGDEKDGLVWDSTPDASSFNIDIQSGNEFAFDLDLFEGSLEDYNSITVIGGSIDVAVDYTMESDGDLIYFPIATHIRDIVVYKNTGTDGSPTWTVQSDGQWGVDELTGAGGSKDVLYDAVEHWLVFNSTPSNLSKSIRLTGTIKKPIRVRVEEVGAGDPTYATTVYAENVQTEDEAVAYGHSLLAENNAIKRVTFKTYEPGLKPGQNIDLDDSARGLNETLRITKISTRWLGASGHAEFTVECGNDESEDAGVLIANNDIRSRENRDANVAVTSTINTLFDADGTTVLTDTNGRRLYESA